MSIEGRLAELEARLSLAEDRLEILDLVASYGPLVDSGQAEAAAALWTANGIYEVDGGAYAGHEGLANMVRSDGHQALLQRGCAHLTGLPWVTIEGDRAVALAHSQLLLKDERGFRVARAGAHRWELRREAGGWRVVRRTTRLLDGSEQATALFRRTEGDVS